MHQQAAEKHGLTAVFTQRLALSHIKDPEDQLHSGSSEYDQHERIPSLIMSFALISR